MIRLRPTALALCCCALAAARAEDFPLPIHRWTAFVEEPAAHPLYIRRGETLGIEVAYTNYDQAVVLSNATSVLLRYTPGDPDTNTSHYVVTGAVHNAAAGVVRIRWSPAACASADQYAYEIAVLAATTTMVRAWGNLYLDPGVGDAASQASQPTAIESIDWLLTDTSNDGSAPFPIKSVWQSSNVVLQAAADSAEAQAQSNDVDITSLQAQITSNDTDIAVVQTGKVGQAAWQSSNVVLQAEIDAAKQGGLSATGFITGCILSYTTTTSIVIGQGAGFCNLDWWQNSATTLSVTSVASGEDFHYIYISASSSFPTPTFFSSTNEWAWDNDKRGQYWNGNRGIGVVWSRAASATIMGFQCNQLSGRVVRYYQGNWVKQVGWGMDPDGTWQVPDDANTPDYVPIGATAVFGTLVAKDVGSDCTAAAASVEWINSGGGGTGRGTPFGYLSYQNTHIDGWVPLGPSRDIRIMGENNDDNGQLGFAVKGWEVKR